MVKTVNSTGPIASIRRVVEHLRRRLVSDHESSASQAVLMASADAILRDEARPVHAQVSAGLTHAQRAFGLSPWETDLLALTVACADPRVHALVAALQPGHLREPTLAAALSIFELDGADAMYAQTLLTPDERLLRHGLLIAGSAGAPLDRTLTAPPFLIARLCGAHNPTFPLVEAAEPASEASRPAIEVLRSGGVVWITGPAGSGRDWTARRLIAAAGQPFLDLPPDLRPERRADVEREAIWWGAGLLVRARVPDRAVSRGSAAGHLLSALPG